MQLAFFNSSDTGVYLALCGSGTKMKLAFYKIKKRIELKGANSQSINQPRRHHGSRFPLDSP